MGKIGTVYAIVHERTGKIYVGSTGDIQTRVETHISKLRNNSHPCESLQRDFNDYGDRIRLYILYQGEVAGQDLKEIEHTFMSLLHTRHPERGYNDKDASRDFCLSRCKTIQIPETKVRKEVCQMMGAPESFGKHEKQAPMQMAEKEREMLRQIHDLPPQLREKFLEQIKGANMALDFMSATPPEEAGEEPKKEGG